MNLLHKAIIAVFVFFLQFDQCLAQETDNSLLLNSQYFDLRGKISNVLFFNDTNDTLKLNGEGYNYLPMAESMYSLTIKPKDSVKISISLTYPDFISFNQNNFRVWLIPGKTLHCSISSISPFKISFMGELSSINEYYASFDRHFNNTIQESEPYYLAGEKNKNFNEFIFLSDSITMLSLGFLDNYKGYLPQWFKKSEYWRLRYNQGFRNYNVPFAKEFSSGKKIDLQEKYFSFEKQLPIYNPEMALNAEYIWYIKFFLRRKILLNNPKETDISKAAIMLVDSICPRKELAHILKAAFFFEVYKQSKIEYKSLLESQLKDTLTKNRIDSLIKANYEFPVVGKIIPNIRMEDLQNNKLDLYSFKGKYLILNFWATWCKPCIKEIPFENTLAEHYLNKNLTILNICVESKKETWYGLLQNQKSSVKNFIIDEIEFKKIKRKFNLDAYPRSILIAPDLKVLNNYLSPASVLSFSEVDNKLLNN